MTEYCSWVGVCLNRTTRGGLSTALENSSVGSGSGPKGDFDGPASASDVWTGWRCHRNDWPTGSVLARVRFERVMGMLDQREGVSDMVEYEWITVE